MFCKNCGNQFNKDSKFCGKCGDTVAKENLLEKSFENEPNNTRENIETGLPTIKCGNCGYVGAGEPARSLVGKILAWICVVFAPLVTIIYFVATHKYRCPKCKSTFLGVKNEHGVFVGQTGGANRIVIIFVCVLVGIAIIGILASVVLASLNTARSKGQDASIKANLSNIRAQAELYWDSQSTNGKNGSYLGLCKNDVVSQMKNSITTTRAVDIVCNDNNGGYAISAPLNSGGYWCVDSLITGKVISTEISNQTSCSLFTPYDTTNTSNTSTLTGAEICARDIPNSTWDGSYISDGSYSRTCKSGYNLSSISNKCVTNNQICSESFSNTYSTGIDPSDGKNICDCKSGYTWNSAGTACY